jgi:hypothetical protein
MEPHFLAAGTSTTGWVVGYTINDALTEAVHNTAPLGALRTTIDYAVTIIGGLQRGRARLGDDNA